jgi:murein DD-endopeptidase MepM/ murein hydrolase activator NlpD
VQVASARRTETRARGRRTVGAGGLLLGTLAAGAVFVTVGGDHGRLPAEPVPERPDPPRLEAPPPTRPSDDLSWPLRGEVTGQYGEPRGGRAHEGLDIPMPAGTPIKAAASGRVIMREDESGYGKYTCVAHRTISTCYAHQSRFRTKRGARVKAGQVIGYVGDTGSSTTTHLHFEVRRGTKPWGKALNPRRFISPAR